MVKKKGKRERKQQQLTLFEKKEEANNVSEQWDKGWIHVIRIHDTTHLAVTTTQQTDAHELPPHKERMNDITRETKGQAKRKN